MATKKKAAKKKTTKKKSASKAMVSMAEFEQQMMEQANLDSARTGSGGGANFISIRGGSFTYQEADLGEEIEVVVLDFVNVKDYYDSPWDQDNPSSPACWSVSYDKPSEMVPSEYSPVVQAEACAGCWANEFGSADRGKGKACRDGRRMAVISKDQLDDAVEDIEIALLKAGPSSCPNFDKYIKGLAKVAKRPCYGVVTTAFFDDNMDYEVLKFRSNEKVESPEHMQKIMELREQVSELLTQEHDPANYVSPEEQAPARGNKKAAKKKAAKKKGSKFSK